MQANFRKYYGVGLLALVALLFILSAQSGSTPNEFHSENVVVIHHDSHCLAKFHTGVETTHDGTEFATLNLQIENENMTTPHLVEVIISKKSDFGEIGPGKYRIAKDKDGFLRYMDGVFGFLDSKDAGKLPFFAHFGEITIAELDDKAVNGYMDIYFKNAVGDSIHMQGDFIGQP